MIPIFKKNKSLFYLYREVKDGKGDQYCIDIDLHTGENLIKPSTCWNYPDSPVLPSQCTVNTDPWCRAGVHTLQSILPLISSKQQQDGPILLPILGNDVKKELYDIMYAITPGFLPGGLPSLDGGGVCFKELFLGHSATLDAYHPYYIPHRKVSRHIVSEWLASRDTSQAGNWWQVRIKNFHLLVFFFFVLPTYMFFGSQDTKALSSFMYHVEIRGTRSKGATTRR